MGRPVKSWQQRKVQGPCWPLLSLQPLLPYFLLNILTNSSVPSIHTTDCASHLLGLPASGTFSAYLSSPSDCTITCAMTQCSTQGCAKPTEHSGVSEGWNPGCSLESQAPAAPEQVGSKYGLIEVPSVAGKSLPQADRSLSWQM